MKKILFVLLFAITTTGFVSCDMNDPNEDKFAVSDAKSGWVDFVTTKTIGLQDRDTVFAAAECKPVRLPIHLSAPINTDGVDLQFSFEDISGQSAAGLEGTASIAPGTRDGFLVITNPEILTSGSTFKVKLVSTNRGNVSAGFIEGEEPSLTVTLIPAALSLPNSVYEVTEVSDEGQFTYGAEIIQGSAPNELIITNLYGVDPGAETKVFLNADGTLSFPAYLDNPLTIIQGTQLYFEGLEGAVDNICEGTLHITFNLRNAGGQFLGPYEVTLERQ